MVIARVGAAEEIRREYADPTLGTVVRVGPLPLSENGDVLEALRRQRFRC